MGLRGVDGRDHSCPEMKERWVEEEWDKWGLRGVDRRDRSCPERWRGGWKRIGDEWGRGRESAGIEV